MKKSITFLILISSFLGLNAQNEYDILINQTFISNIGSVCEETPEPDPCAGLEVYLILKFTKENISIVEKEISSCGSEYITSKLDYHWELIQNSEIKVHSIPKEIEYKFLKDLVLKIEDGKIIGYKKLWNKKTSRIEFKNTKLL
ncbi:MULTISPECIES: hypothetical protein [Aquimarina]|uniref:hypothetical protein n=1 Tax=Aquimarina TaxID=290174 RepID=UPI000D68FFD6|nr:MULTISPECIES: hypothetical protein [Aquimarina]